MPIFKKHKFALSLALALVALVALASVAMPLKPLIESKLISMLEAKGYAPAKLTLTSASLSEAKIENISFKLKEMDVTIGSANLSNGQWELKEIKVSNAATAIPVLNGIGTISASFGHIVTEGDLFDATKTTAIKFKHDYVIFAPGQSTLTVTEFIFPWSGGTLSAKDVQFSSDDKAPINVNLQIKQVSADALMQDFTGKRATATGKISGTLPVTIAPDGNILFHEGKLQAEGPGTIAVSPEVVPGDNEQVTLVREVLKDFRYSIMSLQINSDKDNRIDLMMNIEGNNPGVQQGRAVKLNVNLKGAVLGFVQQNLLWLTDPRKIMEQGKNAKP